MTPAQLAIELNRSPRVIRAYLRRAFQRHAFEHGRNWSLTKEQCVAAHRHFAARKLFSLGSPPDLPPARRVTSPKGCRHRPLLDYVRRGLAVLFVALNPPAQSAKNGHWFSGKQSAFFKLLYLSGLITESVPKSKADEIVFGGTAVKYKGASYGVTDLRPELVETDSGKVYVGNGHIMRLIDSVCAHEPRIVCIIHALVRAEFNRLVGCSPSVVAPAKVGQFTTPLTGCTSRFICNHFPNGNGYTDAVKTDIFRRVRASL